METAKRKTILLVDDEAIIAATEAMILRKYDYDVVTAFSGERAIALIGERPEIEMVLMDINLGQGLSGTEAAEAILRLRELPVIFLSSHTEREIVEKTEGISSYGYIVKHAGEIVLLASIKMAFRLLESRLRERESKAFRQRIFESSMIPIIVMDSESSAIVDCNSAAVAIYGYDSRDEVIGKTPLDVSPPRQYDGEDSSLAVRRRIIETIAQGRSVFQWWHQRPDGSLWDAEVQLLSFVSGGRNYLQYSLRDITERKRMDLIMNIQHELILELNSCIDLRTAAGSVIQAVTRLGCIDSGGVYILDSTDGSFVLLAHKGLSMEFIERTGRFAADSPNIRVTASGQARYGAYRDLRMSTDEVRERENLRGFATIPVMSRGRLIAILNLASHSCDEIPEDIREALETIAFQIGSTLLRLIEDAEIRENETIFNSFMENSPIYIFFKDENLRALRLSRNYERMLNQPLDNLLGKTSGDLFPPDLAKSIDADDRRILLEGEMVTAEESLNGRWYTTIKFPIRIDGKARYLSGYTIDITERKKAEIEIKRLLDEKSILLKEVHHRIKNNIYFIECLLRLRSAETRNEEVRGILEELVGRVQSMQLLYENLLVSESYTEVSSKVYFDRLIDALMELFPREDRIVVRREVADFVIDTKMAVPLGMIINELVANAFKYAFVGRSRGELAIMVAKTGQQLAVAVADDGVGLPDDFERSGRKGFGHMLVSLLAEQLGAVVIRETGIGGAGVRFTVSLDLAGAKAPPSP